VTLLILSGAPVWAQAPIKIVVPAPPGGAGDTVARLLTEQVRRSQHLSMVIENRPGAATIIGTESVARAAPDGATLLITGAYLLIAPHLGKLKFEPLDALEPICRLVSSPGVVAVNSTSPYSTLDGFLDAAGAEGRALTLAAAGPDTPHHIGFEMLRRAANGQLTFVPYPGGAGAISAVLGGHVTAVLAEYDALADHIRSGRLRPITATAPVDALPQLPTLAQSHKAYELDFWWGLFAPAGTSKQALSRLEDWYSAATHDPAVKAKLAALGFTPSVTCGADFGLLLRSEYDRYGRIVREGGLGPR
jgi:tripartite-type tricarboxylate transporter receptor subunit TctC